MRFGPHGERGWRQNSTHDVALAKANFYKVSLGQYNSPADDGVHAYCMANNVIAVGYGGSVDVSKATDEAGIKDILKGAGFKEDGEGFRYTVSVLRTMHLDMKVGDIVLVSAGNSMVRAIGRVSGRFMDENAPIRFKEFLKPSDWLVKDAEIPVEDLYPKNLSMGTLYSLDRNLVKKDYFRRSNGAQEKRHERYVLIIDEINRGRGQHLRRADHPDRGRQARWRQGAREGEAALFQEGGLQRALEPLHPRHHEHRGP